MRLPRAVLGGAAGLLAVFVVAGSPIPSAMAVSSPFVRGVYGRDSSPTGLSLITGTGFNAVTAMPNRRDLGAVHAAGMKAVVWLGGYGRRSPCRFEWTDRAVRRDLSQIRGHPAILAYQISDEPNGRRFECPHVVEEHRRRAALIRSLDPSKPTYVTLSTSDAGREFFGYQRWTEVADIIGLVVYPCSRPAGCRWEHIRDAREEADADRVPRFWAVMQDFEDDSYYRRPTPGELLVQAREWAGSRLEGYFVYHWNAGPDGGIEGSGHVPIWKAINATCMTGCRAPLGIGPVSQGGGASPILPGTAAGIALAGTGLVVWRGRRSSSHGPTNPVR